ncbi:MAG: lytic murein transglycosylase [Pseudomonadota bacterium]
MADRFEPVARVPFPRGRIGGKAALACLLLAFALPVHADGVPAPVSYEPAFVPAFEDWLDTFRADAAAEGISVDTLEAAFAGARPVERVIELDRRQPEFLQTFSDYLGRRVTPAQVARGQAMLAEHAALFDAVEARHGVPRAVLVAFWGLETNYGVTKGSFNIPVSLATLAWEGRRSAFFKSQLIDALRIVEAGHVLPVDMNGSWAGAMGHMQFMPSTFLAYALDGDGDGRIDLWESLPDALHSAANYLRREGWRPGEPIAVPAGLPDGFDYRLSWPSLRMSVNEWRRLGAVPDGDAIPGDLLARLVLPQGWQGPAFLVFDNFKVVMRWNRSVNYALAVAQLAHELSGGAPLPEYPVESGTLSIARIQAMQRQLNELGFDAGKPDGLVGPRTQSALRRFQAVHRLPVDGYPAPSVLAKVESVHAEAAGAGKLSLAPAAPTAFDPPAP